MTRLFSSIAIIMGVLMIASSLFILTPDSSVYALELVGDDTGLRLEPSETPLFDLQNMYPGDSDTASIFISNEASGGKYFTAGFSIEKIRGSEADLYQQLNLIIEYENEVKYQGPMSGFTEKLDLGTFYPGNKRELKLTVALPGPETGNEFQGATLDVNLVFTAKGFEEPSDDNNPPVPPRRPDDETVPPQPEPEPEEEIEVEPEPPEGYEPVTVETEEPDDVLIIEPEAPEGRGELPRTDSMGITGVIAGIALMSLGLILRRRSEGKAKRTA